MNDHKDPNPALDQRASATVTIEDFTKLSGVKATGTYTIEDWEALTPLSATGTFTISSYAPMHQVKASGTFTVVDYTKLTKVQATATFTVVDFADLAGAVATVDGNALTEGGGLDWLAAVSNDATATSLASAIDGLAGYTAVAATNVVTITYDTYGTAGNAKTLSSSDPSDLTASGATFAGGRNAVTVTVDGTAKTSDGDYVAETSNEVTATNIAAALDAIAGYGAAAVGAVVTVTYDTYGTTGNSKAISTSDGTNITVSGATLSGGVNPATVTVDGNVLTEGTDWDSITSNNATATDLASAIDALGDFSAVAVGAVVTVTAVTAGVAGNSLAISRSDATNMAISGATLSGGRDGAIATTNGVAKTSGADWTAETDNDTTATNLAAAIDAQASLSATATDNVVTVEWDTAGVIGNSKTLATSDATNMPRSGATLAGGQDNLTITLQGAAKVAGTDFTVEVDNDTTATNLATELDGEAGFVATAEDNVVTIFWSTPGTGGNAKTITTSSEDYAPVSGATFAGGVAATYTTPFDYRNADTMNSQVIVANKSGTITVDVTPQFSNDGENWYNGTAHTQLTDNGTNAVENTNPGNFARYKIVLGGTDPIADVTILSQPDD